MPPASQTDVGWVPPEVQKKLKEEEKRRKAAEKEAAAKAEREAEAGAETQNGSADGEKA